MSKKKQGNNDLIVEVKPSGLRIALLKNDQLTELQEENNNHRFSVGDIYLGKARKLMPGLNAAFVDVGYHKDAFLHYLDLGPNFNSLKKFYQILLNPKTKNRPSNRIKLEPEINKNGSISDVLKNGENVIVQIAKEPISQKGPRLASEISIAGRNLVVMPFSNKVSVSQKISSAAEKRRLIKLIESIKPKNYGVIIRTAAQTKKVADLDKELRYLIDKWEKGIKRVQNAKPPMLIVGEINRTEAMVRDVLNKDFGHIMVNDEATFVELKKYLQEIAPDKANIVKLFKGKTPIFEYYNIEKQIKTLFGKNVPMRDGSYLIIEHTEALHVIDVNSGNKKHTKGQEDNALAVNMTAAEEISRQLKLRDMGGIIVIDFIDMQDANHRQQLFEKMKIEMADERAKFQILPLTKFGLMQITRQRVRPEMHIQTEETCPTCQGKGKIQAGILVVDEIANKLQAISKQNSHKQVKIKTHPFLEAYINKKRGLLRSLKKTWQKKFKIQITVIADTSYTLTEYHFFNNKDEEIS
ncbi:MAG: Rne/Rng family ribonuclease [Bacteroidota bacterium]